MPCKIGNPIITHDELKRHLDYDPGTGLFTRKISSTPTVQIGDVAGSTCLRSGYRHVYVGGRQYSQHRLAWLYVYGRWPIGDLDHKNRDKADNRIENLREVTESQNIWNSRVRKDNKSGHKGVYWKPGLRQWVVHITYGGKQRYLGIYRSKDDAIAVYLAAAAEHHGDFSIYRDQPLSGIPAGGST